MLLDGSAAISIQQTLLPQTLLLASSGGCPTPRRAFPSLRLRVTIAARPRCASSSLATSSSNPWKDNQSEKVFVPLTKPRASPGKQKKKLRASASEAHLSARGSPAFYTGARARRSFTALSLLNAAPGNPAREPAGISGFKTFES